MKETTRFPPPASRAASERSGRVVGISHSHDFLAGGGEMGARMRGYDWATTPLGPTDAWPQSLRTAVSLCLSSRFPIILWWGPEMVMLYNDAYIPMPGAKHPRLLGQRGREGWAEIWDIIGPMLTGVLKRGEATWSDDQMLPLRRRGFTEECYFTFSYSPIRDESGAVGGIFTAVTETTEKVLGERRLRTLKDLGERAIGARSVEDACEIAAATLAENRADLPFAVLYLRGDDAGSERLRLCGAVGVEAGSAAAPATGDAATPDGWPLADVLRMGVARHVTDLDVRFGPLPGGPWPEPAREAVLLPLAAPGAERHPARSHGVLVVGISPRRALDDDYRDFLGLVAGQVAVALASARAYEEEKKRAEALAELDRAKTAFFANISHEFRTPLTLLLGPVEDALLAAPGQGLAGESLAAVHRNGLRLLKLVNALLDFSRIEAGRMRAVFEPTDLAAHTAELASAFHSAIERAGLRFVVDCPPLPEPVFVDREMWEKVILNLLSNALKFTREGEIEVRVRAVDGAAETTVRDTGAGIPPGELPRVFERFHRVEGVAGRTHEGTGIGLALVHELVKLHGGAIRVESEYGRGAAFTVSLPFGDAHLPPGRREAARTLASSALRPDAFVEEALRWLPDGDDADDQSAPEDEPVRVLLADDNADMREYLRRLLTARGWAVETAPDGAAALAAARTAPPDLVLADVMMPRLDGIALVKALRADPRTAPLPIILLSARAGEEARVEGLETGADDYLVKPFAARELLARVGAHLEVARLRREAERRQARIAETLQRALLMTPPEGAFPGLDLASAYEPASHEAELGGDFYDAFALDGGRVALVVGDVTGKGLVAASYTAEVKFALRAFLREGPEPAAALTRLNRFLCEGWRLDSREIDERAYVALLVAVVDPATGVVAVAAGGAEPPLLLSARTGVASEVAVSGFLLGADDTAAFDAAHLTLAPGDALILATDGITEARRGKAFFGVEGIVRVAEARHGAEDVTSVGLGKAILAEARNFVDGPLRDDACLLIARRLP